MHWSLQIRMEPSLLGVRKVASITHEAMSGLIGEVPSYNLELALVEACTNAVKHHDRAAEDPQIEVSVSMDEREIRTVVRNPGERFDFDAQHTAEFDENEPDTLPTGGMGIPLMRRIMDVCEYTHEDGVNQVVLVKRIYNRDPIASPASPRDSVLA